MLLSPKSKRIHIDLLVVNIFVRVFLGGTGQEYCNEKRKSIYDKTWSHKTE